MNREFDERRARERGAGGSGPGAEADSADAADSAGPLGLDELLEIESLLRRMPLRRPEAALDGRVLSACRRPVVQRRLRWAAAAALVIAAGAAPVVTHLLTHRDPARNTAVTDPKPSTSDGAADPPHRPPLVAAPARARSVRIERTLAGGFSSDGVVGVAGDAPLHRYRRRSVRQVWIIDPKTGKRTAVTIPREEVVLVRVEPF